MVMQLLIDTNIFIDHEDSKVVKEEFAIFYKLANSNNYNIYYHPHCLIDLKSDKDILQ